MSINQIGVRKIITSVEVLCMEGGLPVEQPPRIAVAAAVLTNPWADRDFVENLTPEIEEIAPQLGHLLTDALIERLDGAPVEAYGKAGVVGLGGELEHASALIHTLRFGNIYRERVGGTSYLPFTNRRASAGTLISIPLVHITDSGIRSHYLTADLHIADAPRDNELVVAIAAADSGRPFARLGDRYQDMELMSVEAASS